MAESTNIPSSTPGKDSPTRRSLSSTPPPPPPPPQDILSSTPPTAAATTMLTMTTLRTPIASSMTSGVYSGSHGNGAQKSAATPIVTSPLAASTPNAHAHAPGGSIANSHSHTHANNNNHSHHHNHNSSQSASTTATTATATSHHHTSGNSGHVPTSKSYSAAELKRKPSLHVALSSKSTTSTLGHNGSSDSLNKSPISPGSILGEEPAEDKELTYKVQRKNYRLEKLRVAQELSTALKNPSIIILSGSLKVRGKLKGWTKLWAVLRPGMLLLYKSNKMKSRHWIATVLLQCCKVIERPSKKDGFCFKVFHPMEQSIWATKGPDGETMGAVVQPLPTTYLICRAASGDNGKCWMDGLELALTCSSLLLSSPRTSDVVMEDKSSNETENDGEWCVSDEEEKGRSASEKSESDVSHIEEFTSTQIHDSDEESQDEKENLCGQSSRKKSRYDDNALPEFSNYVENKEDFAHTQGEQSEVLADENKSLLWFLLKQVRPGMDLSRVVLPTFILEPRSFLDKLSDYYYHADILAKANLEDDPFLRMKAIVRWYLSGFYKKPKGLKKPYNPVLGETFRCLWRHPDGTETFYVAEQVSHHPPVSAFYVSNRKSGFIISAAILAKSKFYGNSTSAILEGQASLTFLNRGEVYLITMPYAHCKGILMGTLSMELGGQVTITCEKTNYSTEMEFKLKGMLSRADVTNAISGKIKYNRETVGYFDGHWDSKIIYKEKKPNSNSPVEEVLWEVTDTVKSERLTRYTIPLEEQEPWESENLWKKVSEAILADDQEAATVEKTKLEEQQRLDVKDRRTRNVEWMPKFFNYDPITSTWKYKHADYQPWDDDNDIVEYECDYVVATHRKRKPRTFCRVDSAVSDDSRKECDILRRTPSDQVVPAFHQRESNRKLVELLRQLLARQIEQSEQIEQLKTTVASIQEKLSKPKPKDPFPLTNTVLAVVFAVAMQIFVIIYWFGDGKLLPDVPRKRY